MRVVLAHHVTDDTSSVDSACWLWRRHRWSRSKGLFAGVSLDGATLRNDLDENQALYGQRWTSKQILGSGAKTPAAAVKLIAELNKHSARERK